MTAEIINHLGFQFDDSFDVQGRLSIADLFPKSKSRCGIYLLNFSDETFYIGQAIDVAKRFAQHRKNYDNIVRFWFQSVVKGQLNEVEQRLIEEAELNGVLLTNKTYVSNIIGETDLDLVIPPKEQKDWLENDIQISNYGYDLYSSVEIKHKIKYRQNFDRLKQVSNYAQIRRILNLYIRNCLPAFKKTELSFWSLSCMPSTNSGTYPRYFCMNVNAMEVFVLGYERKTKESFAFIVLTNFFFDSCDEFDRLRAKFKTLEAERTGYRAAGVDQIRFHFSDLDELERILSTEPEIINSIRKLNLRLMRKGGTIYSPFHCFDLANNVLTQDD
ncbi:GIY-YIG nuclease family protein [Spirosoma spitsbergense]|uniref:GIY-YIG nuclease family protein n=1 Tax=Spirosoma spitsbergense TaxID=431554 RepID=UPI00035FA20E|nr:GIY-YIG nuclease family protein [Spirosoma spitsbergense]